MRAKDNKSVVGDQRRLGDLEILSRTGCDESQQASRRTAMEQKRQESSQRKKSADNRVVMHQVYAQISYANLLYRYEAAAPR